MTSERAATVPPGSSRQRAWLRIALVGLGPALLASGALAQGAPGEQAKPPALWLALLPLMLLAHGALQGVVAALCPRWTAATRESVEQRRWLCLGWGAALTVLLLLVVAVGSIAKGPFAAVGGFIALLVLLIGAFGFTGAAAALGARLLPAPAGEDRAPWQSLVGGLVLSGSCLAPILGQLLGLLLFLTSLGAAARALVTGLAPTGSPPENAAS